jgi:AcrR family transcriptional regulator
MHSVSESAIGDRRAERRRETAARINASAQQLADTHGLDGFSMDELADAAGVSRRTLFNYYPGKDAAVLGDPLTLDPRMVDRFVAAEPTGHLVDDLVALVEPALAAENFDRDAVVRFRRLLAAEPRLVALAHERFEDMGAALLVLVGSREGADHDAARARIVIHVLAALFDIALTTFMSDPTREFPDTFHDAISRARAAFA